MSGQLDNYAGTDTAITAPSSRAAAITPHDTNLLTEIPKAVHNAGTAGTLVCKFDPAGSAVTFYLLQGATLAIRPKIITTASTAASIVALY